MIILKQLVKYDNAVALEATWVDRIETPDPEWEPVGGESALPIDSVEIAETQVYCRAYAGNQMGDLREDSAAFGTDLSGYEPLIAEVEAAYVPPPPPMTEDEIERDKKYLADTDWVISKISEASLTGQDTEPLLIQYDAQIKEREMARVRIRLAEGRQ